MRLHRTGGLQLLTLLAAVAMGAAPLRAADADSANRFIPSDAEVVVFVNVRQLLDAPLIKKNALPHAEAAVKGNADAQKLLAAIGLDPLKDIQSVLLAAPANVTSLNKVLVVTRGNFDLEKINPVAEQFSKAHPDELKITTEGNLRIFEGKSDKQGTSAFVTFPDKQTLLLATSREYLIAATKPHDGVKKELQALIDKADSKASAWMVALAAPNLKKMLAANPQLAGVADKLVAFRGRLLITDNVEAAVHVITTDAKSAEAVAQLLNGLKSIAGVLLANEPNFGEVLTKVVDAIQIDDKDNVATLSVKVPQSLIEEAMKKVNK